MPTSYTGGDDAASAGDSQTSASRPGADASAAPIALPRALVAATRGAWRAALGDLAHAAVESAVQGERSEIALDLGATTEIDASGLGFLVAIRQGALDRGLAVRLLNVAPPIRALLAVSRLEPLFVVEQ